MVSLKQQANMIMIGFLIIGIWYGIGYYQGYEVGERYGMEKSKPTPTNEQD